VVALPTGSTSYGYSGSVDDLAMASLAGFYGAPDGVCAGIDDWRLRAVPGRQAPTVSVGEGLAYGWGVMDDNVGRPELELAAPPTPGERRYSVFARRRWEDARSTDLVAVTNSASDGTRLKAAQLALNVPGKVTYQGLGVAVTEYGSNAVKMIYDRRLWAQKVVSANSVDDLPAPRVGMVANLVSGQKYRAHLSGGALAWRPDGLLGELGLTAYTRTADLGGPTVVKDVAVAELAVTVDLPEARRVYVHASMRLKSNVAGTYPAARIQRVGGAASGYEGGIPPSTLLAVPSKPDYRDIAPAGRTTYRVQLNRFAGTGGCYIAADGPFIRVIDGGPA